MATLTNYLDTTWPFLHRSSEVGGQAATNGEKNRTVIQGGSILSSGKKVTKWPARCLSIVILCVLTACAEVPTTPETTPIKTSVNELAQLEEICPPLTDCDSVIPCDEDEQDCEPELPCVIIGPDGPLPCDEPEAFELNEGKVTGHGVYPVDNRSLSFSFHAISDGNTVKGNFEFHDMPRGPRWHGEITCIQVNGQQVFLEGVVGQSRGGGPAAGSVVTWVAEDNGEGRILPPDRLSDPEVTSEGGAEACGALPGNEPVEIIGGNIQLH